MTATSVPAAGIGDVALPGFLISDAFSAVGIGADSDIAGIHRLHLKGLNLGSIPALLRPCLRLFVRTPVGWEPAAVTGRRSLPVGWSEAAEAGAWRLHTEVCFHDAGAIVVHWRLEGDGTDPGLAVLGAIQPGRGTLAGALRDGALHLVAELPVRNKFVGSSGMLRMRLRLAAAGGALRGGLHREPLPTLPPSSAAMEQPADPDGGYWGICDGRSGSLVLSWAFGDDEPAVVTAPHDLAAAERRWHAWADRLPAPQPDGTFWRRKLAQAVGNVLAATVRAPGYGNFAEDLCCLASVGEWSSTGWFWDHCVASTILPLIDPALVVPALRCHLRHASNGRLPPAVMVAWPIYGEHDLHGDCYAPIATWALLKGRACSGRAVETAAAYPLLATFHRRWLETQDRDGDGLPEWRNSGCPADNSPLYDAYATPQRRTCFPLPPFVSVNLLSYLLMDARGLAVLADELGLAGEAAAWRSQAAVYDRVLVERLWDAEAACFFDRDPQGEPVRVRTFFCLLPLWAGCSLPEADARRAIERHLLRADGFGGVIPFPSVAPDEPTFDPCGYWRGKVWPHVALWNLEILERYGYRAEADVLVERMLRLYASWRGTPENWPSSRETVEQPGVANYNWGAATLAHLLLGWHRQPVR